MRLKSVAALSLVLLAGCGKEPVATQPVASTNSAPAVACPQSGSAYDPLPPGLVVNVPYHLRGDRIAADKKGNYRRRVTFEYLSGDAATVFDSLVASMASAGYKAKEKKEKDGHFGVGFNKKGVGAVLLSVNPKAVPKPAHPDAKGMFVLDFPYKGTIETVAQEAVAP